MAEKRRSRCSCQIGEMGVGVHALAQREFVEVLHSKL